MVPTDHSGIYARYLNCLNARGKILDITVLKLLQLALTNTLPHADYLMFIDADETLLVDQAVNWGGFTELAYYFTLHGNLSYQRNALVSTQIDWHWQGVLHEYLDSPSSHQWHQVAGIYVTSRHNEGARGKDPDTYLKDVAILQQGLKDEPDNLRYQFYLAQSCDAELFELAYQPTISGPNLVDGKKNAGSHSAGQHA